MNLGELEYAKNAFAQNSSLDEYQTVVDTEMTFRLGGQKPVTVAELLHGNVLHLVDIAQSTR